MLLIGWAVRSLARQGRCLRMPAAHEETEGKRSAPRATSELEAIMPSHVRPWECDHEYKAVNVILWNE